MVVPKAVICKWLLFIIFLCEGFISRAQLNANFSATPISGCSPLLVNFTDQSTGNPTAWKWDLGNGTISFLQNPAVTYFAPGKYDVKLIVTNAGGSNQIVKTQYITVNTIPSVIFIGTPLTGCFPLLTQFTDQSLAGSGTITTREWDFGDGNVSGLQNPSHTYLGAGNFNVSLRITNSVGCFATLTKPQYIQIGSGAKADFTYSALNSCSVPSAINFTNTSTGSGTLTYQWDFGDGTTSASTNPSHTYSTSGTYSVRLIIKNLTGCTDTMMKVNAISVGNVKADFSVPANICEGETVNINNTSTSAPASVSWDFGDGTNSNSINPSKSYNTTGNFVIKMIANFGACTDSVSRSINVLPKPIITSFAADKTGSCAAPFTVNFTGTVAGGNPYFWDFGDGTTSTLQNPSHTYTTLGAYDVKLVATNAAGCKDSLIKQAYIKLQAPTVSIPGLPAKDCAPFTFTFNANVNSVDPVVSYSWDFGDGATSVLANPTHTFSAGIYTISVTITTAGGCTTTAIVADGIIAGSKLNLNFTATPRNACAYQVVNFSDLTTGGIADKWLWFFGDGTSSSDQNPTHQYQDTGYFDVTLIVWNNGCPDTLQFSKYIHISPPIAIFSVDYDCANPKQRTFTDHSIGADTWQWDFGDGTTSNTPSPTHIYSDTGFYFVTLTVTNVITGCSYTQPQTLHVVIEKADFIASDTVICKGSLVNFKTQNINAANIASSLWKFGDGSETSSGSGPVTHTYLNAGNYNVTLIITDILGCTDSVVKNLYIRVNGPVALFKSNTPGICINNAITFTDSSFSDGIHPIQKWIWNFGDGVTQTFTTPPFQHSYAAAGVYSVTLTVVDNNGCMDSLVQANSLIISKPIADFISADTVSCHTQQITFSNLSTGPNLTYNWNFGDGTTSSAANPVHQYTTQEIYSVSLSIIDQYGCTANIVKTNYIKISDPSANFSMSDSVSTCPPLVVTFTNLSANFVSRSWDFGDGTSSSLDNPTHFYTTPGIFNVVLTVTGNNGCTDQKTKQIIVRGPQGSFTYTNIAGCTPLQTNFKATTKDNISFIWDFSDGSTLSIPDSIISHVYANPGTYLPKMILVDAGGCQVPIVGIDTIRVFGIKADFTTTTTTLCDSGFVTFKDQSLSNDIITNYLWNFGDGSTSTLQNPVHSFSSGGLYNTQLKVTTQNGCTDTTLSITPIKIVSSPKIAIASNNGVCIPAAINFNGQILQADTSSLTWNWEFGNGKTSRLQNPSQIYLGAGSYTVRTTATNSSGCKDTASKIIIAYPLPDVNAGADAWVCKGQSINLSATGAAIYSWTPTINLSCSNCANPVAKPDTLIEYTVQGTSINGCIARDTLQLLVKAPFKMNVSKGDTLCLGRSANLNAVGADTYIWFPKTGLNNSTIPNPVATPSETTKYMVVGSDNKGCFKDTGYVPIKVYPIPTVNAGNDKTINVGQTLDLDPVLSADVTNVMWTPTSGIFRNRFPGITVKPPQTTEYTVEATNIGGCKARDKVTVYVLCNNANVFIPNTFSPNGDGANDIFYPRGTGLFSIKNLRIFNRWGEIVFEKGNFQANDASSGWNGVYKGKKLDPDVFVYTIDILCDNNTILTYKGNVALIQ